MRVKMIGALCLLALQTLPAAILSEGFDDVTALSGAGWVLENASVPVGATGWFQGNDGIFSAYQGASNSYIAANFENAAFGGTIDNWLLTPQVSLANGNQLTFRTRSSGSGFADRLEVRVSQSGASTLLSDFSVLSLSINPPLDPFGYPDTWTEYTATMAGFSPGASGRLAFRYFVSDTSVNGDYVGIDSVNYDSGVVPEPGTWALVGAGLAVAWLRRRQSK